MAKHPADVKKAAAELDFQLEVVTAVVPPKPLAALKKVRVWVEWEADKDDVAARFHVGRGWLSTNGYNPDKYLGVEISNTRNFVRASRLYQPYMVLHELAHAYHFTVLGARHPGLRAAYGQSVERKLYDGVECADGTRGPAYARTNADEYFAELSEAYFGRNDFFPFTRADLEKHDPAGFALMKAVWGDPRK